MLNTRTESITEMENNLKDNASALVEGHVLIKDTDTGEVLLNKHNAINFTNMALAMARVLGGEVDAGSGLSYVIKKMAFGNGGTLIDGTGTIEYRSTNTDTEAGALYNKTYEKLVDGTDAILPSENTTVVQKFDGLVYSDIVITSTLDYTEPAAQATIDNSTNLTGNFAFDEIGLITETGSYISHIIFHPIEKSANRKIQVIYTIRIRAGS
tara:strand:- start:781 stop:1413 length:633 start_codon:yes stop_codon:yes gene_type:complete